MPPEELITDSCVCNKENVPNALNSTMVANGLEILPNQSPLDYSIRDFGMCGYRFHFDISVESQLINNLIIKNKGAGNGACGPNAAYAKMPNKIDGIQLYIKDVEENKVISPNLYLFRNKSSITKKKTVDEITPTTTNVQPFLTIDDNNNLLNPIVYLGMKGKLKGGVDAIAAPKKLVDFTFPFIDSIVGDPNNYAGINPYLGKKDKLSVDELLKFRSLANIEDTSVQVLGTEDNVSNPDYAKIMPRARKYGSFYISAEAIAYFIDEDVYKENKNAKGAGSDNRVPKTIHPWNPYHNFGLYPYWGYASTGQFQTGNGLFAPIDKYNHNGIKGLMLYRRRQRNTIGAVKDGNPNDDQTAGLPNPMAESTIPGVQYKNAFWIVGFSSNNYLDKIHDNNTAICEFLRQLEKIKLLHDAPDVDWNDFTDKYEIYVEFKYNNFESTITNNMLNPEGNDQPYRIYLGDGVARLNIQDHDFGETEDENGEKKIPDPVGRLATRIQMHFSDQTDYGVETYKWGIIDVPTVMFLDSEVDGAKESATSLFSYIDYQYSDRETFEEFGDNSLLFCSYKTILSNRGIKTLGQPFLSLSGGGRLLMTAGETDIGNRKSDRHHVPGNLNIGNEIVLRFAICVCNDGKITDDELNTKIRNYIANNTNIKYRVWTMNNNVGQLTAEQTLLQINNDYFKNSLPTRNYTNIQGLFLSPLKQIIKNIEGQGDQILWEKDFKAQLNNLLQQQGGVDLVSLDPDSQQPLEFTWSDETPDYDFTSKQSFDLNYFFETADKWLDVDQKTDVFDPTLVKLSEYEENQALSQSNGVLEEYINIYRNKLLEKADTLRLTIMVEPAAIQPPNSLRPATIIQKVPLLLDFTYPLFLGTLDNNVENYAINKNELITWLTENSDTPKVVNFIRNCIKNSELDTKLLSGQFTPGGKVLRLYFGEYAGYDDDTLRVMPEKSKVIKDLVEELIKKKFYGGPDFDVTTRKGQERFVAYAGKVLLGKKPFTSDDPLIKELNRLNAVPCRSKVEEKLNGLIEKRNDYINKYIRPLESIRDNQFISFFEIPIQDSNNFKSIQLDNVLCPGGQPLNTQDGPPLRFSIDFDAGDTTNTARIESFRQLGIFFEPYDYSNKTNHPDPVPESIFTVNISAIVESGRSISLLSTGTYAKCGETDGQPNLWNIKFAKIADQPRRLMIVFELPPSSTDNVYEVRVNKMTRICSTRDLTTRAYLLVNEKPNLQNLMAQIYGFRGAIKSKEWSDQGVTNFEDLDFKYIKLGPDGKKYDVGSQFNRGSLVPTALYNKSTDDRIVESSSGKAKFYLPPRDMTSYSSLGHFFKEWYTEPNLSFEWDKNNTPILNYQTNPLGAKGIKSISRYFNLEGGPQDTRRVTLCSMIYLLYTLENSLVLTETVNLFKENIKTNVQAVIDAKAAGWNEFQDINIEGLLTYKGPQSKEETLVSMNKEINKWEVILNTPGKTKEICGTGTLGANLSGDILRLLEDQDLLEKPQITE